MKEASFLEGPTHVGVPDLNAAGALVMLLYKITVPVDFDTCLYIFERGKEDFIACI